MIAFVRDLIFSTRIQSTAVAHGAEVTVVRTIDTLRQRLAAGSHEILLIDLDGESDGAIDAIRVADTSKPRPRILAFVSHVRTDLIEAARAAGADEVMARSAFVMKLPAIVRAHLRATAESAGTGDTP